jgi:hypothetical protein
MVDASHRPGDGLETVDRRIDREQKSVVYHKNEAYSAHRSEPGEKSSPSVENTASAPPHKKKPVELRTCAV